jgi:uncharacterized membrane protein
MKTLATISGLLFASLPAGCAGPLGPPLGLGPGLDQLAGLVLLVLVVLLVYLPLRRSITARVRPSTLASAQAIVRDRYARGEIAADEYERLMQHLSQT